MFPNFIALLNARADDPSRFVEQVRVVREKRLRNPQLERLLVWCWFAIVAKCIVITWLVQKYHMPFDPLWVNAPTVLFGLMCTAAYIWRE